MCMYVVFCKIDHCIHIHRCIVMGLGHNDPWVESHMWPQQTWGQRSSRGQWPLVQILQKRVSVSTYFDVFSNLIYYNECKRMWSRKQARHVVREPPCMENIDEFQHIMAPNCFHCYLHCWFGDDQHAIRTFNLTCSIITHVVHTSVRDFCVCDWLKDHTWACINTVHGPTNNQYLSIFGTIFRNRYDCF